MVKVVLMAVSTIQLIINEATSTTPHINRNNVTCPAQHSNTLALSTLRSRGTPHVTIFSSLLPQSQAGLRGGMCRANRNEGLREREANFDLQQQRNAFNKISMQFDQVGGWSMRNTNRPQKLMAGQQLQVLCLLTTFTRKHFQGDRTRVVGCRTIGSTASRQPYLRAPTDMVARHRHTNKLRKHPLAKQNLPHKHLALFTRATYVRGCLGRGVKCVRILGFPVSRAKPHACFKK